LAEICFKYLKKGKLVYIEGYLKTRSWDTPEGVRRFKTEIVVQDMIMLDKRSGEADFDYIPQDSSNEFEINSFDEQEMPSEQVSAPQAAPSPQNSFPNDNQQKNTPTGPIGIDDDLGL
jgi:single-strand DNA-binding protein